MTTGDITIQYQGEVYNLEELDTGATSNEANTAWSGFMLLACHSTITNNQHFAEAIELLVQQGFAGRLIGAPGMRLLKSINIRRRLTAQDRLDYGEDIHALVRITYNTFRLIAAGGVENVDGLHIARMGKVAQP